MVRVIVSGEEYCADNIVLLLVVSEHISYLSMCDNVPGGKNRVESSVLVLVVAVLMLPALGLLGQ